MIESLNYFGSLVRFPFALRKFLQRRLTLRDAKDIVRARLSQREENFLRTVEHNVYGYAHSPYLPLLRRAGCELGDLRSVVKHKGIEGALCDLRAAGVYVTLEEFKGRKSIQRNGLNLEVASNHFDNPARIQVFATETGGSSGAATEVPQNFDQIVTQSAPRALTLAAWQVFGAPTAYWRGILPDSTIKGMLQDIFLDNAPRRWFSNLHLFDSKHWLKYALGTYSMLISLRVLGARMPFPEFVSPEQAVIVARYLNDMVAQERKCLLRTSVSRAVRVALAAEGEGLSLNAVTISAGGEPITLSKARAIERAGARLIANYALSEAGTVGNGCPLALSPDDVHLFTDEFALITHPLHMEEFDVSLPAFNLTSLLPSAPKILLNLQVDDYGIVEEHACGCDLGSIGYTTHLSEIRSFGKLVGEGVTLIGSDMLRILEEVLPARFGGSPLDYQLSEQENESGLTQLYLLIHPRVEIADESAVIVTMMDALKASPMSDAARSVWSRTRTLKIKRAPPKQTQRGKLLPLHITRNHNIL